MTDHEPCAGAAQPKNDGGDFLGVTKSPIGISFIIAGSGMGLAKARAFAEAGAAVTLADLEENAVRSAAEELLTAGHKAIALPCDVADEANVAAMVEQTVSTFGRLDVASDNAGVQSPAVETADASGEQFDRVNAINLRGVWNCMKYEVEAPRRYAQETVLPRVLTSPAILLIADLFHPIDDLTVERFLDGDVCHGRGRRSTVPVLLAWRDRDHIAGMNLLNRTAVLLRPTATGDDDQGLTERMGMPRGACTRLERDACARRAGGCVWLEQGVDAHRAGKPVGRSFAGWL